MAGLEVKFDANRAKIELADLRKGLLDVGRASGKITKELDGLGNKSDKVSKKVGHIADVKTISNIDKLTQKITETKDSSQKLNTSTGILLNSFKDFEKTTLKVMKDYDKLTKSQKDSFQTIQNLEFKNKSLAGSINLSRTALSQSNKTFVESKSKIKDLQSELGVVISKNKLLADSEKLLKKELVVVNSLFGSSSKEAEKYKKAVTPLVEKNKNLVKAHRELTREMKETEKIANLYAKESTAYKAKLSEMVDQNRRLIESYKAMSKNLSSMEKELNKSTKQLDKEKKKTLELARVNDNLKEKLSESTGAQKLLNAELKKSQRESQKHQKTIDSLTNRYDKLKTRLDKASKSSTKFSKAMKKIATVATGIVVAKVIYGLSTGLVNASKSIIKLGSDFEKTMAIVGGVTRTIIDGKVTKDFNRLVDIAKQMGEETEWSSNQAAGALKYLGMAGFSAVQSIATLKGTLDLATSGNIDLARAADISTNALTAMNLMTVDTGKLTQNMTRVNSSFINTITSMNVDVEQLAESFKYAAPKASALGMEIESLNTWLGLLGNAGIQGSMAGTQMAFALGHMGRAFDKMDISGKGKSFVDMLEAINKHGWDANDVTKVFAERGSRAVLALRNMVPYYREMLDLQIRNKNAAEDLAKVIRNTVSAKMDKVASLWKNIQLDVFQDSSSGLAKSLDDLYNIMRENKSTIKKGIDVIMQGTIGTIKLVTQLLNLLGKISNMSKNISEIFNKTRSAQPSIPKNLSNLLPSHISWLFNVKKDQEDPMSKIKKMTEGVVKMQGAIQHLNERIQFLRKNGGGKWHIESLEKESNKFKDELTSLYKELDLEKRKMLKDSAKEGFSVQESAEVKRASRALEIEKSLLREKLKMVGDFETSRNKAAEDFAAQRERNEDLRNAERLKFFNNSSGKGTKIVGGTSIEIEKDKSAKAIQQEIKRLLADKKVITEQIAKIQKDDLKREKELVAAQEESNSIIFSGKAIADEVYDKLLMKELSAENEVQIAKTKVQALKQERDIYSKIIAEKRKDKKLQDEIYDFQIFKRNSEAQIKHAEEMSKIEQDAFSENIAHVKELVEYRRSMGEITHEEALKQNESLYRQELKNEMRLYRDKISLKKKEFDLIPKNKRVPGSEKRLSEEVSAMESIFSSMADNFEDKVKMYMASFDNKDLNKTNDIELKHQEKMLELARQITDMEMNSERDLIAYKEKAGTISHKKAVDRLKELYREELTQAANIYREKIQLRKKEYLATPENERVSLDKFNKEIAGMDIVLQTMLDDIPDQIKAAFDESINAVQAFKDAVQSSLGGVFTDALTGDLDSALSYFQSFANNMASVWGGMMSKMLMSSTAVIGGLSRGMSFAALGVAGLAIGGISSILNRSAAKKAKRKELRKRRDTLNSQIEDEIAQLEMSDISYEIFQTTKKLEDMAKEAHKTGANIEELNKLRTLETKRLQEESAAYYTQQMEAAAEPYTSLIDKYSGWQTNRTQSGWGVSDWKSEVDKLGDQLLTLSKENQEYFDVAEAQLDALMKIVDLSEQQLQTFEDTQKSLSSQRWDLMNGDLSGTTSVTAYQSRYEELFSAASESLAELNANIDWNEAIDAARLAGETNLGERRPENYTDVDSAIKEFQGFVNDWIDVKGTEGFDYNELLKQADLNLGQLEVNLEDPMESLRKAIEKNTESTNSNTIDSTNAIRALVATLMVDRNEATFKAWSEGVNLSDYSMEAPKTHLNQMYGLNMGQQDIRYTWSPTGTEALPEGQDIWSVGEVSLHGIKPFTVSEGEKALEATTKQWAELNPILSGWLTTAPTELMSTDQIEIRDKWLEDIANMPNVYDPKEKSYTVSVAEIKKWYDFFDSISDNGDLNQLLNMPDFAMPTFASGGWSNTPAIFGEAGYGEYVVPDENNPNNTRYLRSVGADPEKIGKAIADRLMPFFSSNDSGQENPIIVNVNVDGKKLASTMVNLSRKNREIKRVFK